MAKLDGRSPSWSHLAPVNHAKHNSGDQESSENCVIFATFLLVSALDDCCSVCFFFFFPLTPHDSVAEYLCPSAGHGHGKELTRHLKINK